MNFNKRINTEETLMDLTPIVDVVFNLLIFFALSLNFSQITSSINIKLLTFYTPNDFAEEK